MAKTMDASVVKLKNDKCVFCKMKIKDGEKYVMLKGKTGYAHARCLYMHNCKSEKTMKLAVKTTNERRKITGINLVQSKKISDKLKGRILTEEHRRKVSEALKGKKHTEERKQNMRKPKTEEHKRKLSEARKGITPFNKGERGRHWYTDGIINKCVFTCPPGFWAGKTVKEEKAVAKIDAFKRTKLNKIRTCFGVRQIPENLEFIDGPNCYFCNEIVEAEEHMQFSTVIAKKYIVAHTGCAAMYKGMKEGRFDKSWFFPVKCTTLKMSFDNVLIAAAYLRKSGITTKKLQSVCDMICKCCREEYESIYKLKWIYLQKKHNITKPENWNAKKPVSTIKKQVRKTRS